MEKNRMLVMATRTDISSLIVWSEGVRGGRPHIAGTGVTVRRIVGWYKLGFTPEEIADRVGHLSLAQGTRLWSTRCERAVCMS